MHCTLKPIACRPWLLQGLSQKLIESHYENNSGGALRRLNAIAGQLDAMDFAKAPAHVLNGLKRDQLAALNSTLLHELYFASMGGDGRTPTPVMAEALARDFGSVERWREEFVAMAPYARTTRPSAACAMGSGTARDSAAWSGWGAPGVPGGAFAAVEAASVAGGDAGVAGADAVAATGWFTLPHAGHLVPGVAAMMAAGKRLQFIDARPRFYAARAPEIVEGAQWKDPEEVQRWSAELSKSDPVVVYCAYGFHIGCKTAGALRDAGFDAVYMKGGHSALKALGGTFKPLTTA